MANAARRLYLIPVLTKALDILELLQSENQPLTLDAIHRSTQISKTTIYRVLKTFVHRGYASQSAEGTYRQVTRPKKLRFGFGSQSADMPFSVGVTRSLTEAARSVGVDLLILDNSYDSATAVRNAEEFVRARVDLVIEFQTEQDVAPIVGDKIAAARIPLVAIDIPHPNATYFGVDNFRVGAEAGEVLAQHALTAWGGKTDWVLGLDLPEAGTLVQGRISGAFDAIRSAMPALPVEAFVRIDARGMRDKSHKLVAEFLDCHPRDRRILIAAATDSSALGAIDAARRKKRERHIAVVGQDCIPEALAEMKQKRSPLIASISHEVETYGPRLIELGLALVRGQTVAPYNYVAHRLVRGAGLDRPAGDAAQALHARRARKRA